MYAQPTLSVELIYRDGGPPQFGWDEMRKRVAALLVLREHGTDLKLALRADYAHAQSLPPEDDEAAVATYVQWCQELAADPVFGQCTWMICGNEPNLPTENSELGRSMPPAWVARVVYGYGTPTAETGNVYQFVHTANPGMQVLLPAVAPYSDAISGNLPMPVEFPPGSPPRAAWAPWERYQYELFVDAYDNNWHDPLGDIKSALHAYAAIGNDSKLAGGSNEPNQDFREGIFQAQFGTRWLQDALYLFRKAQGKVYGVEFDPWVLVTECNTWRDPSTPEDNYEAGWWTAAVAYVDSLPNVMGVAAFVDEDLDGAFGPMQMSAREGGLALWDDDHDQLLKNGW